MKDKIGNYIIHIIEVDNEVYWKLFKNLSMRIKDEYTSEEVNVEKINILNVIGDFINIRKTVYIDKQLKNKKDIFNYLEHIFTDTYKSITSYEYENIKKAFQGIDRILSLENGVSDLTLVKFEELKSILGLNFISEINIRESGGVTYYPKNIDSFPYEPKDIKERWFSYYCDTIADMVFSVLHYYMINNYKLIKCQHCGKYFAAKILKEKFCRRTSPYPDFGHLECKEAVKNIRQKFRRRYNSVNTNLNNYYPSQVKYLFQNEYRVLSEKVRKYSSVNNLQQFENFLYDENFPKRWYKK